MTPLNLPTPTAEALERLAAELGLAPADVVARAVALVELLRWLTLGVGSPLTRERE